MNAPMSESPADGITPHLGPTCRRQLVRIGLGPATLEGDLHVPDRPTGLVVFAHGSGSSRRSPRNRWVASRLNRQAMATLLLDLLTEDEGRDRRSVFDIDVLCERLTGVIRWTNDRPELEGLSVGLFGASTGAAAALAAAADAPDLVEAIVSRGGRPDLLDPDRLSAVRAPTLLVVGGADPQVLRLNRSAADHLRCAHRVEVIAEAGHLFSEAGALDAVARAAGAWFAAHLRR